MTKGMVENVKILGQQKYVVHKMRIDLMMMHYANLTVSELTITAKVKKL